MNDEVKKYAITGTVTIGTDEYRDLIEGLARSNASVEDYRSRMWAAQRERDDLKKAVIAQQKNDKMMRGFIYADEERLAAYDKHCRAVLGEIDAAARNEDDYE